jgi:hypothetical protein
VFGPNANSTATGRNWMNAVCTNPP